MTLSDARLHRLEWISFVYLVFFVLAVLSPSIYTRGFFGLSETTLEELTIFAFGMAGVLTFTVYERIMERREREQMRVETDYQHAKAELMESYAYIGSLNRKLELLKKLANDTSTHRAEGGRVPKELFQVLLASTCAASGAQYALLRIVEIERLRTEREWTHITDTPMLMRVANRDARTIAEQGLSHAWVRTEDGHELLCVPSDREHSFRTFLFLSLPHDVIQEIDVSLLKVFVNQAHALYEPYTLSTSKGIRVPYVQEVTAPTLVENAAQQ